MHRTLLVAAALVAAFSVLVAISYSSDRSVIFTTWLPQFILEFSLSVAATVYIWHIAWHRTETSWLLALLATSSLLLTLGLLPATIFVLAELAEFEVLGNDHPAMGIGVVMLFTGLVTPLMGATLWWHRNKR